jgi:hypothetical protein
MAGAQWYGIGRSVNGNSGMVFTTKYLGFIFNNGGRYRQQLPADRTICGPSGPVEVFVNLQTGQASLIVWRSLLQNR